MGVRSKGKRVADKLFGGRKISGDHEKGTMTSAPPMIVVQGEPSEATGTHRNALGVRNTGEVTLNGGGSTPTNALSGGAAGIARSEYDVHGANTQESGGFLHDAHHFTMMYPTMVEKYTNIVNPVASDREVEAKKLLSRHMIPGAAHDSSARDPPPQCHPGTRIKIIEGILAWFYDEGKQEFVLWVNGPAGVGKSAIVQTIAEALAKAKCLGASVFFSRPNGRNQSISVFTTAAYQLAVHIKSYCVFISEKLASDPELVNKGMKEQFRAFIVEPFVEKKIGAGGKTWAILLDGLDELDERHWQREIIVLITTFVSKHPDVPLAWIISSRPEPHITTTFEGIQIPSTYREEYVPTDSPEACRDVERFLRGSFQTMHQHLPHIVPQNWPDEIKFAKLARAASGLFAYADVAVRYIDDPKHADPATRLDDVLSVIDRLGVSSLDDHPFSHLDAMYTLILASIPARTWLVTRRALGSILWSDSLILSSAKGVSVILGLELSKVYTSFNDLFSVLDISRNNIYSKIKFRHASFSDFLSDATRSKEFHIPSEDTKTDLRESCLRIWLDFKRQFPQGPSSEYEVRWSKYASHFHSDTNPPVGVSNNCNRRLLVYIRDEVWALLRQSLGAVQEDASQHHQDQIFDLLRHMDAGFIDDMPYKGMLIEYCFDIWKMYQDELTSKGIAHEIQLGGLQLDHLEWPKEVLGHYWSETSGSSLNMHMTRRMRPSSLEEFDKYISGLKYFQQHNPTLQVLACGTPGNRYAVFIYQYSEDDFKAHPLHMLNNWKKLPEFDRYNYYGYYCIPYP